MGLCVRILLVSDVTNLSQDCCSWSVFPCSFEICICFPVVLKWKEMAYETYCHCLASSWYCDAVFSVDRSFVLCSYQRESLVGVTSTTHSSSGNLRTASWEECLGSGVAIYTGHYFNAYSAASSLPTHIETHLHSFCIHIKLIIPVNKSLQTSFWSQCHLASNGRSWQRKEATSITPKDFTVWAPCQV